MVKAIIQGEPIAQVIIQTDCYGLLPCMGTKININQSNNNKCLDRHWINDAYEYP